jgi:hypothetical protein
MNLTQVIRELKKERNRLDAVIRALESGLDSPPSAGVRSPRGRKSMEPAERAEVAERMRRYWAGRKAMAAMPVPNGNGTPMPPSAGNRLPLPPARNPAVFYM